MNKILCIVFGSLAALCGCQPVAPPTITIMGNGNTVTTTTTTSTAGTFTVPLAGLP